jgi:hypothetical protein
MIRVWLSEDADFLVSGVARHGQPQLSVQIGLIARCGVPDGGADPFEVGDQAFDVLSRELNRWRRLGLCGLSAGCERGSPCGDLGDPAGDDGRVSSGVSDGPVLGELGVALGNLRYKIVVNNRARGDRRPRSCGVQAVDGVCEPVG